MEQGFDKIDRANIQSYYENECEVDEYIELYEEYKYWNECLEDKNNQVANDIVDIIDEMREKWHGKAIHNYLDDIEKLVQELF